MKTTLRRYRERTPAERRAVLRAGLLIGAIQTGLAVLPFRTVLRIVYRVARPSGPAGAGSGDSPQFDRDLAVWAVEAAGRRLLSRNPCLPMALAVLILFRRGGEEAELHLGVARESGRADRPVHAHAWVVSGGCTVMGGDVPLEDYTPLPGLDGKFPNAGRTR